MKIFFWKVSAFYMKKTNNGSDIDFSLKFVVFQEEMI